MYLYWDLEFRPFNIQRSDEQVLIIRWIFCLTSIPFEKEVIVRAFYMDSKWREIDRHVPLLTCFLQGVQTLHALFIRPIFTLNRWLHYFFIDTNRGLWKDHFTWILNGEDVLLIQAGYPFWMLEVCGDALLGKLYTCPQRLLFFTVQFLPDATIIQVIRSRINRDIELLNGKIYYDFFYLFYLLTITGRY